ncbi:hypothetical protein AB0J35_61885 [Nonomuraea angiospora]|uniref:hypothetical protein n=1 Tax=Nonomuraea angiospora TaxID=46172 RepID=UPI00341D0ED2
MDTTSATRRVDVTDSLATPRPYRRLVSTPMAFDDDRAREVQAFVLGEGSLRLGYLTALRGLPHLITPFVLLSLPANVLGWLTLPLAGGSNLAVIRGEIVPVGRPGASMLVWTAITLSYVLVAGAVAGPATVLLAVGRLLGRVVSPGVAMRMAARKWRTWLVPMGVAILTTGAIGGAGLGLVVLTEQAWPAIGVMVLVWLASLPMLLTVPVVVLEDRGAFRAIGRAYWLTSGHWFRRVPPLLIGIFVVPGLMSQVPLVLFFGMVLAPFQASMVALSPSSAMPSSRNSSIARWRSRRTAHPSPPTPMT